MTSPSAPTEAAAVDLCANAAPDSPDADGISEAEAGGPPSRYVAAPDDTTAAAPAGCHPADHVSTAAGGAAPEQPVPHFLPLPPRGDHAAANTGDDDTAAGADHPSDDHGNASANLFSAQEDWGGVGRFAPLQRMSEE